MFYNSSKHKIHHSQQNLQTSKANSHMAFTSSCHTPMSLISSLFEKVKQENVMIMKIY